MMQRQHWFATGEDLNSSQPQAASLSRRWFLSTAEKKTRRIIARLADEVDSRSNGSAMTRSLFDSLLRCGACRKIFKSLRERVNLSAQLVKVSAELIDVHETTITIHGQHIACVRLADSIDVTVTEKIRSSSGLPQIVRKLGSRHRHGEVAGWND